MQFGGPKYDREIIGCSVTSSCHKLLVIIISVAREQSLTNDL